MRNVRGWDRGGGYGFVLGLAVVSLLAPSCGDDDSSGTGAAGSAGSSATGSPSTTGGGAGSGSGGSTAGAGGSGGAAGSNGGAAGSTGGGGPSDAGADRMDAGSGPAPVVVPIAAGRHARFYNVTYTASGIYAVGQVGDATDAEDMATVVVKLLATGAPDMTFGTNGIAIKNVVVGKGGEIARGIVVQQSGKIVVAGAVEHGAATDPARDVFALRLSASGTPDGTFGSAGVVRLPLGTGELVQQWGLSRLDNDDLIVVGARKAVPPASDAASTDDAASADAAPEAGGDGGAPALRNEFAVIRLKGDNGAVDNAFGPGGDGVANLPLATNISPRTASILPDGKMLVSGYTNSGGNKPIVFKLTSTGRLDMTFASGGIWFPESGIPGFGAGGGAEAYGATLQGDKLVTVGYGRETSAQPANGWISFRLNADGSLDNTYGTMGHVFLGINDQGAQARAMTVLSDKRVVLVGAGSPPKASADAGTLAQYAGMVILTENGQLDPAFAQGPRLYDLGGPATGRAAHFFWGVSLSPDQKNVALVGIKGGVTANADAGVAGGVDEAVFLHMPTGN